MSADGFYECAGFGKVNSPRDGSPAVSGVNKAFVLALTVMVTNEVSTRKVDRITGNVRVVLHFQT